MVGSLNWCARVIRGGRSFLRGLIDCIAKVRKQHHYVRLSRAARENIHWWTTGLDLFNGSTPFPADIPESAANFSTDACLRSGGGHFNTLWFHANWAIDLPELVGLHINILELFTILIAAECWGHLWKGRHIMVRSDNYCTVTAINKGSCRSEKMILIIQQLFWLSVIHNFKLTASFIPGRLNILSDRLSRLDVRSSAIECNWLLTNGQGNVIQCIGHMTPLTFVHLQISWTRTGIG
jgi:hypothetical protein